MRKYRDVLSSGPGIGSVTPSNGQSHANGSATKMVPVLEEADVVRVSPPSKFRQPSRPSKGVHMDSDPSYSRLLVGPHTVPSFTSDIPGPNSSATAQQGTTRRTHFNNPVSYDPGVNKVPESRETYAFLPDSSTLLSGAELSLTPLTLSSKANGTIETHSNNNSTVRVTSRSPLELMATHQISSGGGYSFLDERQWTEGVSTPISGIPLHY
jgi:hypothetical protein